MPPPVTGRMWAPVLIRSTRPAVLPIRYFFAFFWRESLRKFVKEYYSSISRIKLEMGSK